MREVLTVITGFEVNHPMMALDFSTVIMTFYDFFMALHSNHG